MHEPPLDLTRLAGSRQKEGVRVFYKEMWDRADTALIFTFDGERVRDLWVLGDIHGLIGRLEGGTSA
jgi:hypothetical protein